MNMNYGFYVSRFLKVQMTLTLQDMIFLFSTYQKVNPKFTLFLSRKSNSVNSIDKKIEKNQKRNKRSRSSEEVNSSRA